MPSNPMLITLQQEDGRWDAVVGAYVGKGSTQEEAVRECERIAWRDAQQVTRVVSRWLIEHQMADDR